MEEGETCGEVKSKKFVFAEVERSLDAGGSGVLGSGDSESTGVIDCCCSCGRIACSAICGEGLGLDTGGMGKCVGGDGKEPNEVTELIVRLLSSISSMYTFCCTTSSAVSFGEKYVGGCAGE